MHGHSIEDQRKLERTSEANLLEPMSLEDLLSQWNGNHEWLLECRSVLDWRDLRRTSWKKLSIPFG